MKLSSTPLLLALLTPLASAQWATDPAVNLPVADASGDQVQPKVAPTADGGCYISWFDSIANGFDVRLQKLDAGGNELWAHNGVLVFDRSYSSTQDYGLDVDASGNALLAFRDDSGATDQITASMISPAGALLWGASGITVSSTTGFVASPRIAGTSDGHVVVAWTEDSSARLQRLDATGSPLWGAGLTLTPATGTYSPADLHDSGTDVILSMVFQTGPMYYNPKNLVVQKFDAAGTPLWGTSPLNIFDSGSLQIGNYPYFEPDGAGGGLFCWYGVSPLQSYVQHVLASGTEAFPHNGAVASTNTTRVRVNPSVDYDAGTGETYLFWTEQNSTQSQCGLYGQKFDASGNALWGTTGSALIAVAAPEVRQVHTRVSGAGAFVFWTYIPSYGTDVLRGAHVSSAGAFDIGPFDVGSTPSVKSRLDVEESVSGMMLLAWSDQRTDGGDILAQNVNPDGSLGGGPLGTPFCFGNGCPCGNDDATAGCANSTGSGALLTAGGTASASADNLTFTGTNLLPGQGALLFSGPNQVNGGVGLPFGDGLRCAGGGIIRLGVKMPDGTGTAVWGPALGVKGGWVAGDTVEFQGWYRDPGTSPCSNEFNTTHGVEIVFVP